MTPRCHKAMIAPLIIGAGQHKDRRISPNSAWPLRDANGRTWAERKEQANVGR